MFYSTTPLMKFLVTEVRTVRVDAPNKRAAIEKGRMVLENYAPDTIDVSVEEIEAGPKSAN